MHNSSKRAAEQQHKKKSRLQLHSAVKSLEQASVGWAALTPRVRWALPCGCQDFRVHIHSLASRIWRRHSLRERTCASFREVLPSRAFRGSVSPDFLIFFLCTVLLLLKSVYIARTIITTRLTLSRLCRLLLVRIDVYIVTLSDFYSYRLIGKLTAFLQFQEFSQRNPTWELRVFTFAAWVYWISLSQNVDCYSQRLLIYVLPSIWMAHLSHLILTLTHHIRNISVINLVSIFRCSSSKTNSVYARLLNSLVLGCSLS